ncbi:antibiotic biosynthesis monooxygenase family protein [Rubrimonas cliftonensis]|uniref:Heme-degrading monooxygenase HmoA n=1 Tax=Rubrimonas cliftonensis TaxID=89524 RepID=A0A1H4FRM1_9RHOB|nr:antibiotic biosynthesis monooxygenase [Rubrimonas cliftonensis]SEA99999.1 Heme-degrading monooxygenase HmoA [Rubrimonas cliftonensis]
MVIELAILRIRPGQGPGFENAFDAVRPLLASADGHLRHRFVRTVDDPDAYLLEVAWRDLDAHVNGFEPSEAHARFMAALEPHLSAEPVVIHVPPGVAA